jgi:hypothetical protein
LRRVRYREPPEGVFLGSGTGQKCVSSPVADDVDSLPANGRKTAAPPPAVETRRCDGSFFIDGKNSPGGEHTGAKPGRLEPARCLQLRGTRAGGSGASSQSRLRSLGDCIARDR